MPEINLDGTGILSLGDPLVLGESAPLNHFADLIVSGGMPLKGGVSESIDGASDLEDSSNYNDRLKVEGYRQSQKNVWDYLPLGGLLTGKGKKSKSKKKNLVDPVPSQLPNTLTDQNALLPDGMPLDEQDTLVAKFMDSNFAAETVNPFSKEQIEKLDQDHYTYTGSDLRVVVEVAGGKGGYKQLVELSTITVSIHRGTVPVRACGYINPKAFVSSTRTIAGTIILTQFWMDSLLRFLATDQGKEFSDEFWAKDISYSKIDQLPPLNFTFYFADEHGHASVRRLLGVKLVTDGTVYSVNDQLTEQTISYMAMDFTPLQPVDVMGVLKKTPPMTGERTPKDVHTETFLNYKGTGQQNIPLNLPQSPYKAYPGGRPRSAGENLLPGALQTIFKKVLG